MPGKVLKERERGRGRGDVQAAGAPIVEPHQLPPQTHAHLNLRPQRLDLLLRCRAAVLLGGERRSERGRLCEGRV